MCLAWNSRAGVYTYAPSNPQSVSLYTCKPRDVRYTHGPQPLLDFSNHHSSHHDPNIQENTEPAAQCP